MAQLSVPMDTISAVSIVDVAYDVEHPGGSLNSSIIEREERNAVAMQFDNLTRLSRCESLPTRDLMATEPYLSMPPLSMRHLNAMNDATSVKTTKCQTPSNIVWKMNLRFEKFKRFVFVNSIYSYLFLFIMGIAFGLNSFTLDYWRYTTVDYISDDVVGSSMTVLGAYNMKRIDNIVTADDAYVKLTREVFYSEVESNGYCGSTFAALHSASNPPEVQLFRSVEQIGLLDSNDGREFIKIHGSTIYDVLCSEIGSIAAAGKIMFVIGLFSYMMFILMSYLVMKRALFPEPSQMGDIARMVGNICNVMWIMSIAMGLIGFVGYVVRSEGQACVDAAGTATKCPLYISSYFFVIYLCSNALCFVSYLLYGRSLALDRLEKNQSKF